MLEKRACIMEFLKELFIMKELSKNSIRFFCASECKCESITANKGERTDNMYHQLPISFKYHLKLDIPKGFLSDCYQYFGDDGTK